MKFVVMIAGVVLALILMNWPTPLDQPKPRWWRVLAIFSVIATCILGIAPPIAGSITDAVIQHRADPLKSTPTLVFVNTTKMVATDARDSRITVGVSASKINIETFKQLGSNIPVVAELRRLSSDREFEITAISAVDPQLTLPYIVGLEERARILFFHVPLSWAAVIGYFLAMLASVRFIRRRSMYQDQLASSYASVGTLFTVLATLTGAVWAKFNWGTFWNWDPRQTSILLLLLIYAAYFLLRSAIEDPQRRARLSAVYAILAFVTVPFLMFVLPRLMPGLHPGSSDDVNIGPLLSPRSDAINPVKNAVFGLALFSFTLVFGWIANLRIRTEQIEHRLDN